MNKSELVILIIMRFIGIVGLLAIPAALLPMSWMNAIHAYVGLGEMPEAPVVAYLARSLSLFYAIVCVITLFISFDLRRYRPLVLLWAVAIALLGVALIAIDVTAGMPTRWTLIEGPRVLIVGLVVICLHNKIAEEG